MNNLGHHFPQEKLNSCLEMSQQLNTTFNSKKLTKLEKMITSLSSDQFDSLNFSEYKQAIKTLSSIKQQLDSLKTQSEWADSRIADLSRDLLLIRNKLTIDRTDKDPVPLREKIDVTFGILCDFSTPDSNGEVARDAQFMLNNNMPFIATHSIMCGSGTASLKERHEHLKNVAPLLEKWEIFELMTEKDKPSGLFVFLPSKKEAEDKNSVLKRYDLSESGRLTKVKPERVLSATKESPDINALKEVFSADPKMNKIFYLVGHGKKNECIAGMAKNAFPNMLQVLKSTRCQGLLIDSCYIGGTNSDTFLKTPTAPPFPVILSSSGDFIVEPHRTTLNSRLNALQGMIENPLTPQTTKGYRKQYESIQHKSEKKDYDLKSLMQILLPGSKEATSSFHAIGEGDHLFPVTSIVIKQAELTREPITASGEMLGFYPKIVSTPIQASSLTTLCSMQPGDASHLIKELSGVKSAKELIDHTLQFSKQGSVNKGFCIGKIHEASGNSIQEVVVLCTTTQSICAYQREGKYYAIQEGRSETEISPLKHALLYQKAVLLDEKGVNSNANAKALLLADENSGLFYETVSSSKEALKTWGRLIDAFEDNKQEITYEQAANFFTDSQVLQEDKEHLLWGLFLSRPELALKLLENITALTSKAKNYTGSSVTNAVLVSGDIKVIEKFIEKGVDFYEQDERGVSGFDVALGQGNWPVIQRLLQIPHTIPITPNFRLLSAINKFLEMDKSTPNYIEAKKIIDQVFRETAKDIPCCPYTLGGIDGKTSLLGTYAFTGNAEAVNLLLEAGYSPNMHNTLYLALSCKNDTIVELLLKNGADPLQPDSDGHVPLIESAAASPAEIFEKMLQLQKNSSRSDHGNSISNIADASNITPLSAALISRDPKKIEKILNEKVELPDTNEKKEVFLSVLRTFIASDDKQYIGIVGRFLTDKYVLEHLTSAEITYLLQNDFFESAFISLGATSEEFAKLIQIAIVRNDQDRLSKLGAKLEEVNLNLLSDGDKRYLIKQDLIDAEKLGIVLEDSEEDVSDETPGSSDSDSGDEK